MRKIFIFAFFLLLSFGVDALPTHTIAKIFEEGKAIELNDGSIWAIGYWRWNDPFDQQVVTADWQVGDHVEFSLWHRLFSKTAFHITNLRSGQSVRSWLYLAPHEESLLLIKEINPSRNTLTLEDGTKWQSRERFNTFFNLYEVAWDRKVYLLKNTWGNYYLCRASSEIPQGVEVFQIHD